MGGAAARCFFGVGEGGADRFGDLLGFGDLLRLGDLLGCKYDGGGSCWLAKVGTGMGRASEYMIVFSPEITCQYIKSVNIKYAMDRYCSV